jgi:hypothetical protein
VTPLVQPRPRPIRPQLVETSDIGRESFIGRCRPQRRMSRPSLNFDGEHRCDQAALPLQQLPASADAFVWLRPYQLEMDGKLPRGSRQPLWWTLRRPFRPLAYHGAHRMCERIGAGTDATLHSLRRQPAEPHQGTGRGGPLSQLALLDGRNHVPPSPRPGDRPAPELGPRAATQLDFNVPSLYNRWWHNDTWRGLFDYDVKYGDDTNGLTIRFEPAPPG